MNRTSRHTVVTFSIWVLALLLIGLLSGFRPLTIAHGTQGEIPSLDASTPNDRADLLSQVEDPVTGETVVIEPAGKVSWQDMLDYEASHPIEPGIPRVIPYMPPPAPQELMGAGTSQIMGETTTVAPAGEANWEELLDGEADQPVETGTPKVAPYMPGPGSRELTPSNAATASPHFSPLAPPGMVNNFNGLEDNNASIPPDTMGAAGPNHLMVMLNTQVRIQSKTGVNISTVSLDTFWTSGTGLSGDPFDPKVVYDSLSGRWMATVDADSKSPSSAVWFAISDTSDPTGSWTFYAWDADSGDTYWADYPGFGVNATWIAITNNMFTNAGSFGGAKMWVIDKATALAGGSLTTTVFPMHFDVAGGYDGFTLKPALTFDPTESTLFIVDGNKWSSGGVGILRLSQITGTGPLPAWSVVPGSTVIAGSGFFWTTETYNLTQVDADQLGTTTDVATNDPRLLNAVLRNGRLWTTHTGGLPFGGAADRTISVWYEINPGGMPTPIVQSGVVGGSAAGTHYFFPSITANANNDVALGFSYSDATQFVEGAYTGRESGDPAGTMGSITTCKAGEDSYIKDFAKGIVRWGDYSATVVDPNDDLTFWTLQEYAEEDVGAGQNNDRWGTWWCRIQMGNVWEGDDATNPTFWNVPANWSSGAVPNCTTDAIIPTTPIGGVYPTVNADANVRNLTIGVGATLNMSANNLNVCGNWDKSGTFNSSGGTVDFNGGTIQNLTANVPITFTNLTISSGTTLSETVTSDNISVSGTLTNSGRIGKSMFSLSTGLTNFGLTGGSVNIATLGNLNNLQVDRVGSAHPNENANGGGAYMLDTYYTLTPDADDQSFDLELCLSYTDAELAGATAVSNEANLRLCRWNGSSWSCPNRSGSSSTANNTVCAANVDTLSDWTIGETSPTAITLRNMDAHFLGSGLHNKPLVVFIVLAGLSVTLAGLARRSRGQKAPG